MPLTRLPETRLPQPRLPQTEGSNDDAGQADGDGDSYDAVVVGAGFNGLYQLWRLRAEGYSVRLVEAESGVGGVWQSNRYPGARVDSHVPNYEYSIEAVWRDWTWTERFPGRDELVAYFDHVDAVLDLSRDIDFDTRIERAIWSPGEARWRLAAADGRRWDCRWLIMCTGFGSKPYVPAIDGLEDFGGEWYHTARWPQRGVDFERRRIGVIGTGASGVQVTQEAARDAGQLVVFQRSPVMALPMQQRKLSAEDQRAAKPRYPEMFAKRNAPPGSFHDIERRPESALDVSAEERTREFEKRWDLGGFHFWVGTFRDVLSNHEANRTAYDFWRDKVRARVDDPATAELLAPTDPPYPFGTKRPSLEQGYYKCFNQPNVELVDLHQTPIEHITPTGVRTRDRDIELDVLVVATGFDANTGGLTAIDIRGRDGRTLADEWADGVDTHLGVAVHGFPNLLFLYGPQSSASFCNGPVCAEIQGDWTIELVEHMRSNRYRTLEPTEAAGPAWTEHLAEVATMSLFGLADSWYMGANIPGKRRQLLNYPNGDAYLAHLGACRDAGWSGFVFA